MNTKCRAEIINIAGKRHILGRDARYKTTAAEYQAIKQEIAAKRRERRAMRAS
jgi:hypothetical protein